MTHLLYPAYSLEDLKSELADRERIYYGRSKSKSRPLTWYDSKVLKGEIERLREAIKQRVEANSKEGT